MVGKFRQQPISELDEFDRASPALDCVILTAWRGSLRVVIVQRTNQPFVGDWALPGVFINYGETESTAVTRALAKARLEAASYTEQLVYRFDTGRDPRGWVTTVSYLLVMPYFKLAEEVHGPDAAIAEVVVPWQGEAASPVAVRLAQDQSWLDLAFDHSAIIGEGVSRFRSQLLHSPIGLELMPDTFTLSELRLAYEAVLGRQLNRASFQRHVVDVQRLVEPTGDRRTDVAHRPASLYTASDSFRQAL